jgi:hypothetical protein
MAVRYMKHNIVISFTLSIIFVVVGVVTKLSGYKHAGDIFFLVSILSSIVFIIYLIVYFQKKFENKNESTA